VRWCGTGMCLGVLRVDTGTRGGREEWEWRREWERRRR
jgi:hypothetical protein